MGTSFIWTQRYEVLSTLTTELLTIGVGGRMAEAWLPAPCPAPAPGAGGRPGTAGAGAGAGALSLALG